MTARVIALTALSLVGFAANSLLCRLALGKGSIDAYAFTAIRIASGALTLALLVRLRPSPGGAGRGSWWDALWLAAYALPFSIAYRWLDTGTGALLLFGAVQVTLILWAIRAGERPSLAEGIGLVGAGAGLVYLVFPGLTAPDPSGAALMLAAGVAWGLYTAAGKRGGDPLLRTGGNFARGLVFVAPVALLALPAKLTTSGILLAVASGAVASGLGYAAWYAALPHHTATRAALLQLSVPVLAAAGGIAALGEPLTLRWIVASALVLGSLAVAVRFRRAR
jgi:drug/metabolite transporter (DMT)-like permease